MARPEHQPYSRRIAHETVGCCPTFSRGDFDRGCPILSHFLRKHGRSCGHIMTGTLVADYKSLTSPTHRKPRWVGQPRCVSCLEEGWATPQAQWYNWVGVCPPCEIFLVMTPK